MHGAVHNVRILLLLLTGSVALFRHASAGQDPAQWPRTGVAYVVPEINVPAVRVDQIGAHRRIPFEALQSGQWKQLSDGDRVWHLSVQSRGAKALRVHISSFRPDAGVLYVSGEKGVHPVTERGESWSSVIPGDTLWMHYRPLDTSDTDLPFAIDMVSHVLAAQDAAGAVPYLQVEQDGTASRCQGWALDTPAASSYAYFLTSQDCVPDAAVAATAVLWHGGVAHTVKPVLVASRRSGELNFSLLRLEGVPATLPREKSARQEIAAALPHLSSFFKTSTTATPERTAESTRTACGLQPLSFGVSVNADLSASDCRGPGGKYYTDEYTFTGSMNQRISITMTSAVLDSYLTLYHPSGALAARNDDGAGGLNARIDIVLSTSGVYRLEASTFHEGTTGPYVLRLDTSGIATTGALAQRFVAVSPCRVMDTRAGEGKSGAFGPPMLRAGTSRDIMIAESGCGIPSAAAAFSLNVTVVPQRILSYLTVYPAGQARPVASTLNSFEGRVVSNAALIPAGSNGRISIFVTDDTDVIVDINGFFIP